MQQASAAWGGQYLHGISAPMNELEDRLMESLREDRVKETALEKAKIEDLQRDSDKGMQMQANSFMGSDDAKSLDPVKFKRRKGGLGTKRKGGKNNNKRRR